MCTLYQIMYALTSFREWSVPDSGSPHNIRQGVLPVWGDDHYLLLMALSDSYLFLYGGINAMKSYRHIPDIFQIGTSSQ